MVKHLHLNERNKKWTIIQIDSKDLQRFVFLVENCFFLFYSSRSEKFRFHVPFYFRFFFPTGQQWSVRWSNIYQLIINRHYVLVFFFSSFSSFTFLLFFFSTYSWSLIDWFICSFISLSVHCSSYSIRTSLSKTNIKIKW